MFFTHPETISYPMTPLDSSFVPKILANPEVDSLTSLGVLSIDQAILRIVDGSTSGLESVSIWAPNVIPFSILTLSPVASLRLLAAPARCTWNNASDPFNTPARRLIDKRWQNGKWQISQLYLDT